MRRIHITHCVTDRTYCGRAAGISVWSAARLSAKDLESLCGTCRYAAFWPVLDEAPATWDGQGCGQIGDSGTTMAIHPWSGHRYRRSQGYSVPLPGGARGWTEGRWHHLPHCDRCEAQQ